MGSNQVQSRAAGAQYGQLALGPKALVFEPLQVQEPPAAPPSPNVIHSWAP